MFLNMFFIDMVRTRRALVPRDRSSSHDQTLEEEPRRRPTTCARRRGKGRHEEFGQSVAHGKTSSSTTPDIHEEPENVIQHEDIVAEHDHDNLEGFLGGPEYISLLTGFADHVACAIWDGRVSIVLNSFIIEIGG